MNYEGDLAPLNFCGCPDKAISNEKRQKASLSNNSKRQLRVYYKCNCDSALESDYIGKALIDPADMTYRQADGFKSMIKRVTESEPITCPWNEVTTPLMQAIYRYEHIKKQNEGAFNENLPNILYEAILMYEANKTRVYNYWFEEKEKKRETERKMKAKASRTPSTKAR